MAYVVPEENPVEIAGDGEAADWDEWQSEQVPNWESVWDQTFSTPSHSEDPTYNTAGVMSSYTGEPISANEARDWVDHAAKRVLSLKPERVLDVGCGLGRTLFRVGPYCRKYVGVDFSKPALDYVKDHLNLLENPPIDLWFLHASANQLQGIANDSFDLVIINGVVMYFPSMHYLVEVIEQSLAIASPDGCIFVGDVRSLPLLDAFHFQRDFIKRIRM